ncbi:cyclin-T isoform X1 [Bombus pascuorum]|uniref:cyclin-T isoform X1 n=2 Tax=Bombus pascuorum TaxID=65598 RepID=UPI00298E03DC|nr:cyclin-T isoform X1 [Bombus pascuorum]
MATDEKWYFTKEQLTNTPSRRCGIDADKELSYRQQAANFIQDMGQRLVVSQLCINTAIVYMHRFYVFHSLSHFHRNAIAAAALFLAAKVEEQPRKLEHVIKMAHMCLHRDQPPPDVRSEQYLEQAQDLVFNENVLLQTLGFDVAIDHPHTHVVRCCQLVKASKDLAQTSYFMASNSLHLTTMCLQYKPTVVACFCIHLACKWSNWEIPQSTEGKHWFWYVDRSVTSELLQELTAEFLHIFDKCPSRLKRKIMSISANQSPSINHPSLPNSPFDAEPRKVQSPATTADGGPTFHANRPHLAEKQEEKKQNAPAPTRPPVDYREYREKKERERLEREKASVPASVTQSHVSEINKHHSHHHKPVSSTNVLNKHPLPLGQKTLHHNHHHRPDIKVGQPVPQRHSSSTQAREPNRDPNRQRLQREYNSNTGISSSSSSSGSALHSHSHAVPKEPTLDNSVTDSVTHRSDVGSLQEPTPHGNIQDKLSNNNHSLHRLSGVESKHQGHDKRMYDPRHKPVEHRKDSEQKPYKYPDPTRVDRQRKSDTLEQRCEEVRKLIEKSIPPPKPTLDVPYSSNTQKPSSHHIKYNQSEKLQVSSGAVPTDVKLSTSQSSFSQEKSPSSSVSLLSQKSLSSKTISSQHTAHGVSQILKDTIKNSNSQSSSLSSLSNLDDPKTEKRPRHDDTDKSSSDIQQSVLQTPPSKPKSLFSPEKVPTPRESHSQRLKTKQKTPPSAAKVPKQERVPDTSIGFNLVSPFASPPGLQQQETQSVKRSANDVPATSHKRHRTCSTSESGQQVKIKMDDTSSFEAVKMLGRVPELIQPIRDNPSANGRATQIANDMKPPELIKPFDSEPTISRFSTIPTQQQIPSNQQGLTNGLDTNLVKQESQEFQIKKETYKTDIPIKAEHQIKGEYLSPMKSAQSISALLQEPLAPMPSLLQNMQQFSQIPPQQQVHQEQFQQQQLQQQQLQHEQPSQPHQPSISHSMLLAQQEPVQSQCLPLSSVTEPMIASTVDISVLSGPVQTNTESILSVTTSTTITVAPPVEEKRLEHHKSEKKKKKEKHKHKDKEKSKEKHKHKHKDKDKEKHREKDKEKGEEIVSAIPIKITIPKDKLNLSTESTGSTGASTVPTDKNKSPQNTSIKIIIPKERLKGTDSVSSSPGQSVVQAPLRIKIRTDGISRSSGAPSTTSSSSSIVPEFTNESRKRDRSEMKESPTTSVPLAKKQSQVSSAGYGQHRLGERLNGRHYSSGSNNKVRGGGRGGRQYIGRGPPPAGSAGHYSAPGQRDGYYQQDTYNSNNARNPHHPHPSSARGDPGYSRAGHVNQTQPDSYFFANYPPPSMFNPAGYIYDPVMYYSQYQQQYPMYPAGNVIMTPDGAIDTSVPPPSLPPNMRQNQSMISVPSARQEPETPPPLPSGPPPSSSPPPPPPPE